MDKLYRYESITSELKVWAERSPLSEWTDTTIVKKLRFQILLSQTRNQPDFQAIPKVVRGNQNHLESLIAGVASYVDNLLTSQSSSPDFEIRLFHQLTILNFPQFNQLEFSTLELFDLVTNLELLTLELEILPIDLTILSTSLGLKIKRINPIWFQVAAAAIATVSITTATRFLLPKSPEYSQSIANLNSSENSAKLTPEPKSQQKLPNNSTNSSQPQPILPSPRAAQSDRVKSDAYVERISPNKPQTSTNTASSPQPKFEQKPLLKSIPKPPPKSALKTETSNDFASLSEPKVLKSTPNPSRNESPIPTVKTPDRLSDNPPVTPAPINPSITSESEPIPLGLSDSDNSNRSTAKSSPEPQRARTEITPFTSSQTRGDSDRLSNLKNGTVKGQNPRIEVIKISGSPSSQDLQTYKQKIITWQSPKSSGEINIEVRWQNRQITELKIQPENPELTESIGRSLFEIFSDPDGNIQISLKVIVP
jgi:hypothetical protein